MGIIYKYTPVILWGTVGRIFKKARKKEFDRWYRNSFKTDKEKWEFKIKTKSLAIMGPTLKEMPPLSLERDCCNLHLFFLSIKENDFTPEGVLKH
jgi:hypothetical protein